MMAKCMIFVVFAVVSTVQAGVIPTAGFIAPYASSYNAHHINHAVAHPVFAAPAPAQAVLAAPAPAPIGFSAPAPIAFAAPAPAPVAFAAPAQFTFAAPAAAPFGYSLYPRPSYLI